MNKSLFEYLDYKAFLKDWIQAQPRNGRGQLLKIAKQLAISSVSVSHIFSGPRHLSAEQALDLSEHLGLSELETEFFSLLVDHARAATVKLRSRIAKKIEVQRAKAQDLKSRVAQDQELDESARAIFYSSWFYSGVRILTSIARFDSEGAIAERLSLSTGQVREILRFLTQYGLCREEEGRYSIGPKKTHLGSDSPLVTRHHANWRLKAIENMRAKDIEKEELFYTGPMTLSREDMLKVRKELVDVVDRAIKIVGPSPSEEMACLNIDWFKLRK